MNSSEKQSMTPKATQNPLRPFSICLQTFADILKKPRYWKQNCSVPKKKKENLNSNYFGFLVIDKYIPKLWGKDLYCFSVPWSYKSHHAFNM